MAATVASWPKILQKSQKGPNLKNILHNFWPKVVETGLKKLDHVFCFFRGSFDKKSTFKNVPFEDFKNISFPNQVKSTSMKYHNFSRFGEKNLFGREINMKPGNSSSQHSPKATARKAAA